MVFNRLSPPNWIKSLPIRVKGQKKSLQTASHGRVARCRSVALFQNCTCIIITHDGKATILDLKSMRFRQVVDLPPLESYSWLVHRLLLGLRTSSARFSYFCSSAARVSSALLGFRSLVARSTLIGFSLILVVQLLFFFFFFFSVKFRTYFLDGKLKNVHWGKDAWTGK